MKTRFNPRSDIVIKFAKVRLLLITAIIVASTTACESLEPGDPLLPADEVKPGPGLFSGESGEVTITTGNSTPTDDQSQLSESESDNLDLQETSELLDEKIKQLDQQKKELEMLKRKVDKKLQN